MSSPADPSTAASIPRKIEATIGAFFAFAIGFILAVGFPYVAYEAAGSGDE